MLGFIKISDASGPPPTIDSDENGLERRLVQFHTTHMMNNPYSEHHLRRLFTIRGMMDCHIDAQPVFVIDVAFARQHIGLDQIAIVGQAAGVIDAEESRRWEARLNRAAVTGGFFAGANAMMVSGRRPRGYRSQMASPIEAARYAGSRLVYKQQSECPGGSLSG